MPTTALNHFNQDVARTRAIVAHADPLPRTNPTEQMVRSDLLRSAWMFAVGAFDAYFCDAYTDAVAATLAAGLNRDADGHAINIGVDVETSVLDFAKLMIDLYKPAKSKIRFVTQEEIYGKSYEDIPRRVPDNTRMRMLLGVEPKVSLRDGTAISMEWFKQEANS